MRVSSLTKIIKKFHWENEDKEKVCGGAGDSDKSLIFCTGRPVNSATENQEVSVSACF